jgi:hypothetical protein
MEKNVHQLKISLQKNYWYDYHVHIMSETQFMGKRRFCPPLLFHTSSISPKPQIPHGNKCAPIKDLSSKKLLIWFSCPYLVRNQR